jgi:ketosteroid isomerase-like protein
MRKLYSLLAIAVIFMAGCSGSSSSPSGVVNSFLTAMKDGDIEKIKTYITESDVTLLNAGQKMAEAFGGKEDIQKKMSDEFKAKSKSVSFSVKGEKVEGDKATVDVEITENGKSETHPFELKKEKGTWKVSLLSTGINAGGSSKEKIDDLNKGLDELKNMNMDSLKGLMQNINLDSLKDIMKKGTDGIDKLKEELQKLKTN